MMITEELKKGLMLFLYGLKINRMSISNPITPIAMHIPKIFSVKPGMQAPTTNLQAITNT